jgi:hypothetical protein
LCKFVQALVAVCTIANKVSQLAPPPSRSVRPDLPGSSELERRRRPVVLATLSVRVSAAAERMAIDSAAESGGRLVIANMLQLPAYPTTIMLLGPGAATLPDEEDLEAVRATAARAAALGLDTQLLRVSSPRPVTALVELLAEHRAGLVVFGPEPSRIGKRRLRAAERRLRSEATCLVWTAADAA